MPATSSFRQPFEELTCVITIPLRCCIRAVPARLKPARQQPQIIMPGMSWQKQSQIFARGASTVRGPLPARFKTRDRRPVVASHRVAPALLLRGLFRLHAQPLPATRGRGVRHSRRALRLQSTCTPCLSHKPVHQAQTRTRYQSPLQQESRPATMRTILCKPEEPPIDPQRHRFEHALCERAIRLAKLRALQDRGQCHSLRCASRAPRSGRR